MEVQTQVSLREDEKNFKHLKENSYYIKYLNRGDITYKKFASDMKVMYKERTSDKVSSFIDNIDLVSTIIDTLK